MRNRTKAREYALQMLYQVDVTREPWQQTIEEFLVQTPVPEDVKAFARRLVEGTLIRLEEIDRLIASHADNWQLNRMAVVDRNILRMGTYELLHVEDVPPRVSLNESVELAKRFGDEESGKFVNGILDAIHKTHGRRAEPSPDSETPTLTS